MALNTRKKKQKSPIKLKKSSKQKAKSNKAKKTAKKNSMNFAEFSKSFKSLDMQNPGLWPAIVKLTAIVAMIAVIALITWALPVSKKRDQIKSVESEQQTLLDTYREKESKARHLEELTAQVNQMEVQFNELLDQLPKDTRVSELVDGINMTGEGSSIRFNDITVEDEVSQEFFIEQPIKIVAEGQYHEFGDFISGIAALPRIITMHDFEIVNTAKIEDVLKGDAKPLQKLTLNTKTYRSKDVEAEKPAEGAQ